LIEPEHGPETVGNSSYHVENTKVIFIKETGEHQDLVERSDLPKDMPSDQWKPRTIFIRLQRNCNEQDWGKSQQTGKSARTLKGT
jgi:hypothetical protein